MFVAGVIALAVAGLFPLGQRTLSWEERAMKRKGLPPDHLPDRRALVVSTRWATRFFVSLGLICMLWSALAAVI